MVFAPPERSISPFEFETDITQLTEEIRTVVDSLKGRYVQLVHDLSNSEKIEDRELADFFKDPLNFFSMLREWTDQEVRGTQRPVDVLPPKLRALLLPNTIKKPELIAKIGEALNLLHEQLQAVAPLFSDVVIPGVTFSRQAEKIVKLEKEKRKKERNPNNSEKPPKFKLDNKLLHPLIRYNQDLAQFYFHGSWVNDDDSLDTFASGRLFAYFLYTFSKFDASENDDAEFSRFEKSARAQAMVMNAFKANGFEIFEINTSDEFELELDHYGIDFACYDYENNVLFFIDAKARAENYNGTTVVSRYVEKRGNSFVPRDVYESEVIRNNEAYEHIMLRLCEKNENMRELFFPSGRTSSQPNPQLRFVTVFVYGDVRNTGQMGWPTKNTEEKFNTIVELTRAHINPDASQNTEAIPEEYYDE